MILIIASMRNMKVKVLSMMVITEFFRELGLSRGLSITRTMHDSTIIIRIALSK
jgi:sulfur transfer protein SufE